MNLHFAYLISYGQFDQLFPFIGYFSHLNFWWEILLFFEAFNYFSYLGRQTYWQVLLCIFFWIHFLWLFETAWTIFLNDVYPGSSYHYFSALDRKIDNIGDPVSIYMFDNEGYFCRNIVLICLCHLKVCIYILCSLFVCWMLSVTRIEVIVRFDENNN